MSEEKIIGKGTWIDKLASELLEREKKLGRSLDVINVERGLGASGIPHIGSLGDAVRAYGVKLALENLGYKSELIAYSDDLDGLRKIPEGMEKFGLEEHIGKPVSLIPVIKLGNIVLPLDSIQLNPLVCSYAGHNPSVPELAINFSEHSPYASQ